ncbi:MAG TPA: hypothetical protein VIU64_01260 [Polyangia bacterium]
MIHGDSSRPGSSSETWVSRRIAARATATALLLAGIAALGACGDSSSGTDQPFPEFEGRWAVDADASSISCPQDEIKTQAISPWSAPPGAEGAGLGVVTLEAGELTDLIETSSECSFGYNVSAKFAEASVANPDPYTGNPSTCVMPLPRADGSSLTLMVGDTQSPLTFQLLKPVKGKAQTAQIVGSADATVKVSDILGNLQTFEGCTFAASVQLHKIAKP